MHGKRSVCFLRLCGGLVWDVQYRFWRGCLWRSLCGVFEIALKFKLDIKKEFCWFFQDSLIATNGLLPLGILRVAGYLHSKDITVDVIDDARQVLHVAREGFFLPS